MAAKRRRRTAKYRKPSRSGARTTESKAKSLQSSWRKATDRTGSLTIAEAKVIINDPPTCPYCQKPPHWRNISIDHIQPRSREGSSEQDNLVFCCKSCNLAKGNLTGEEFKALMAFLEDWPVMKESVLIRLRAGGAALRGRKR
jgi:5-methylcytosine-specific restriction endonuclease McrA